MNVIALTNKFSKILLNPVQGWKDVEFSTLSLQKVFFPFYFGVVLLMFVARLIGKALMYLSVSSIELIIVYALVNFAVDILFFFVLVLSINAILPYYKLKADKTKIAILLMVSLLPFYSALMILNMFPSLFFLGLISLYSGFVLYSGLLNYIKIDKDEINIFFIINMLIIIGVYLVLHFIFIYPFFDFVL